MPPVAGSSAGARIERVPPVQLVGMALLTIVAVLAPFVGVVAGIVLLAVQLGRRSKTVRSPLISWWSGAIVVICLVEIVVGTSSWVSFVS